MTPLRHGHAATAAKTPPNELFQFHPRASNPELWRTTLPLVVRLSCGRHKGLIATWTAIHWLIVLYAASGRCAFGMREIAQEAGVGRNELAGPKGYIQRLVDLGLLRIVGYEPVPGVKEPRPIYHIDLADLERASLELVPALLCERRLPPPPRPAPDPRQLTLFGADTPANGTVAPRPATQTVHETGTAGHLLTGTSLAFGQATHENGTGAGAPTGASTHGNGTVAPTYRSRPRLFRPRRHGSEPGTHETGTATSTCSSLPAPEQATVHEIGTADARNQQVLAPIRASTHEIGTDVHANQPDHARNRDVDGSNERKEGGREIARAHDFHQLVAAAAQATLLVLQQQGLMPTAPTATPAAFAGIDATPASPAGQPPLRASVVELWRGDRQQVSSREVTQLTLIADSYDAATGGFGAYWLGRAIILADMCLSEHGRPLNLPYVRGMLRRWAEEGSWGSDLPCEDASRSSQRSRLRLPRIQTPTTAAPAAPAEPETPPAAPAAPETLPASAPAPAVVPVTGDTEHPAIAVYKAAFGRELNPVQAEEIAKTVTDLATWQQVLRDWQLEDWQAGGVGKMLDRYQKKLPGGAPAASERAPSVRVIHTYPGLDLDQRERWIRKFHAATTPAEKRAVLARLEQEHPR